MPDAQAQNDIQDEQVAVTLMLDAQVYQFFLQKANRAGSEIEPYLSKTLGIVLGCRVFNETHACSPQISGITPSRGESKKQA